MINDLLNVSLITTGNLQLEPEEVDVAKLVAGSIADFATRLKREGIDLDYLVQESVIAYVDKLRIEQAVANLLSNAIKYGDKKPITVKTEKRQSFVRISIKDQGIGISKENQKKIFGLFERGVTNGEYKGLGVGLFITNQIVRAHGGTILVSSKEGHGSEFIIELPTDKLRKTPSNVVAK
jgi:signal transduction histidine kinase